MKKYVAVAITMMMLLLHMIILMPVTKSTTGFGPAEIFCNNQKNTQVIGTASLVNGDNEPKYGVFSLLMPYSHSGTWQVVSSEIIHARVVCNQCDKEMQRWEAIPGYEYGMALEGTCTRCGSQDLLFYKPMPRDEFNMLSLEGAENFDFEKVDGKPYTWITKQQITPGGACNVNVLYDTSDSYLTENFDKHWEFHLRGATQVAKQVEGFVVGGIDLRILLSFKFPIYIEIISPIKKGEDFTVKVTYGDGDDSWDIPLGGASLTFNGETKTADENGYVTFLYPDTRGNYEYELSADAGDDYLIETVTLKTGANPQHPSKKEKSSFFALDNIFFLAVITSIIIIILGIIWRKRKTKKKKSSNGW